MPRRPPIPDIILVVAIERAGVEDEWLSGFLVCRCILIPAVSVKEAELNTPAFGLKRIQKSWDDFIQCQITELLKFRPRAVFLQVHGKHMGQLFAIKHSL